MMILNRWVSNGPANGGTDGHYYRLYLPPVVGGWLKPERRLLSLECIDAVDYDSLSSFIVDHGDNDAIVEVDDSAFDDWRDLSAFAQEIAALLQCEPQTIIRAMSSVPNKELNHDEL